MNFERKHILRTALVLTASRAGIAPGGRNVQNSVSPIMRFAYLPAGRACAVELTGYTYTPNDWEACYPSV